MILVFPTKGRIPQIAQLTSIKHQTTNMNQYFAYIRVSTARQGEQGVSLEQQRDAINQYAERNRMELAQWFEERETAARAGRPVFGQMIRLLKSGKARGVLIHKIDRSARNLKDWADLGEIIDRGVEVHFANHVAIATRLAM